MNGDMAEWSARRKLLTAIHVAAAYSTTDLEGLMRKTDDELFILKAAREDYDHRAFVRLEEALGVRWSKQSFERAVSTSMSEKPAKTDTVFIPLAAAIAPKLLEVIKKQLGADDTLAERGGLDSTSQVVELDTLPANEAKKIFQAASNMAPKNLTKDDMLALSEPLADHVVKRGQ